MNKDILYTKCLQGNVKDVIEYLKSCEDDEAKVLQMQYERRFLGDEPYPIDAKDPWIRKVVSCYFDYFKRVLMKQSEEESQMLLEQELGKLVEGEFSDLDVIEEKIEGIFNKKGYSFLGGRTTPYRGAYIWKTTKKQSFNVTLLDAKENVDVYFISDFLMLSWMHFATFGKHYAGGWAKPEGLYYVNADKELVDTDSNTFQAWFLKHEAQHLSDYKNFPNLDGRNLEYRAKLMELIYMDEPLSGLEKFLTQAQNNKSVHHAYAAYHIIKGYSQKLFDKDYVEDQAVWATLGNTLISETAKILFIENTNTLTKQGKQTTGVI